MKALARRYGSGRGWRVRATIDVWSPSGRHVLHTQIGHGPDEEQPERPKLEAKEPEPCLS